MFNATYDITDDITEILLKVALNTINNEHNWYLKICVELFLACYWAVLFTFADKRSGYPCSFLIICAYSIIFHMRV